jgi:hypothetical protein
MWLKELYVSGEHIAKSILGAQITVHYPRRHAEPDVKSVPETGKTPIALLLQKII